MHASEYRTPNYQGDALQPGVVHMGFGNFARAFIMDIFDDIAEKKRKDLGVVAVAPSSRQALDFEILGNQGNSYHLLRQNKREICQRIDVVRELIIGANNGAQVVECLERDATQIVTLTVTGDGYFPDSPKDEGTLQKQNADTAALREGRWLDLQTPPGWIAAGLYKRYKANKAPFIVMSCDNFTFNGEKTRILISRLARQTGDEGFVNYVNERVVFPNTVVDRITPPQFYDIQAQHLRKAHPHSLIPTRSGKMADQRPVISEDHRELVIEDEKRFPQSLREAFASAKVKFVGDIRPYQDRKLRILNGAHMLCGIGGRLLQIPTVRDVMKDPDLRPLCDRLLGQAADSMASAQPEGEDIHAYVRDSVKRLENPHLTDTPDRLVTATHTKIHARFLNLPVSGREDFESDASVFAIAMWIRYLQGRDESGNPYSLNADAGIARTLGLGDIDDPNLQENLCFFLAKTDLEHAPKIWRAYMTQIADAARMIQEKGLRLAIKHYYPAQPASVYPVARPQSIENESTLRL